MTKDQPVENSTRTCSFASNALDPWCPGCGHTLVVRALQQALAARYDPLDVVLVTDIGCIGMADGLLRCHTVHGLHGRAPALAAGIAFSLPRPGMKVVALLGDGGAAIGLQHILECARLNVDLTLVLANNQNYGMTGGQQSAYTLPGVRTATSPGGAEGLAYDMCRLLEPFDVPRARVLATARELLSQRLGSALEHEGFAFVETLNWCPSYAGKLNPEVLRPLALEGFFTAKGQAPGWWPCVSPREVFSFQGRPQTRLPRVIPSQGGHRLRGVVDIVVAGSAGKGVQSSAEVFARAAVRAGLHVAIRGEYPVTVGRGFSSCFICLSDKPITSPVSETFDLALVCSSDGQAFVRDRCGSVRRLVMEETLASAQAPRESFPVDPTAAGAVPHRVTRLWLASSQGVGYGQRQAESQSTTEEVPRCAVTGPRSPQVELAAFERGNPKRAAFAALVWALRQEGWFGLEHLRLEVDEVSNESQREMLRAVLDG